MTETIQFHRIKELLVEQPMLLPERRILIVSQSWAKPVINMMQRHLQAGDLVFLGSNSIVQCHEASSDVEGSILSIGDDLFSQAAADLVPGAFDGHRQDFQLRLQPEEQEFINHLVAMLRQQDGNSQVALHLTAALLWYIDGLWSHHEPRYRESQTREQRLFTDFMQLVCEYAPEHHTIDFYAARLNRTPRYLSAIIKQVSSKSAKEWIDDALVTRIKIDLKHTDKPIARICNDMHFPNPSFLTKFFKRMTGMTPSQYQSNN